MNVIYGLVGGHTHACTHAHTHTYQLVDKSNFKKPGAPDKGQCVPGLKILNLKTVVGIDLCNKK